jgi:TonB family protein
MPTLQPQTLPRQTESTLEFRRNQADSNRYLPLLITASILIHEGLLLLFMGDPWLLSKAAPNSEKQIPIEFVELDPQQAAQEPPPETDRLALYNSQAQAELSSDSSQGSAQSTSDQSTHQSTPERSSSPSLQDVSQRFEDSAEYARSQIRPDQASRLAVTEEENSPRETTSNPKNTSNITQPVRSTGQKSAAEEALDLPPLDPDGLVARSSNSNAVLPRATPLANSQRPSSAALGGGGQVGLGSQASSLYTVKNDRSGTGQGTDARQDVNLGPYLSRLKSKVEGAWSPNTNSSYSQVVLHFSILKNGTLDNLNIAHSSGQSAIDQAALNAVQQAAAGFEPLPEGYQRDALHIEFTFTVRAGSAHILH